MTVDPTLHSQPNSPASSANPLSAGSMSGWPEKVAHSSGGKLAPGGGELVVSDDEDVMADLAAEEATVVAGEGGL